MRRFIPASSSVFLAIILSSCAAGPDYRRPAAPALSRYTADKLPESTASARTTAGDAQQLLYDRDIPEDWWTLFASDELNEMVEEAIDNNPDLQAAQFALLQARENANAGIGPLFPSLDFSTAATRQRVAGSSFGSPGAPPSLFTLYNATVNVSYAPDVFGGTRRQIESLEAQAEAERFQVEAAYLSLVSNVITAAVQVASLRSQIEETERLAAIEKQQMDIVQDQFRSGVVTKLSVFAQETALDQTRATLPLLRKQLAQKQDQLSVLTGHFPSEGYWDIPLLPELRLPKKIPVSLPSALVEQRPDIRASDAQLHAASAQIGVETANMLPHVTLNGGYGTSAFMAQGAYTPEGALWNFASGLTQPIFHGGELWHKRRAAVAGYERALALYRSTVLLAFENVSDVLHALYLDAENLKAQLDAVHSATQSLEAAKIQFKAGSITYLSLLDSQRSALQAQLGLVQARANRLADTAALFQALGGGWWNRGKPKAL